MPSRTVLRNSWISIPALEALHRQYLESRNSDLSRDTRFIVEATGLLMRCCPVG